MLKGKTAVITGGSRGIGREIALKMAENGANIAVIYSGNEKAASEVSDKASEYGVQALSFRCNVADFEEVKKTSADILEKFGAIDILVNNAGITRDNLLLRMTDEDFNSVIDVNLKGAFYFIKQFTKALMRSPSGRIINITSVSGLMGNAGQANYSASKAGLIGLTKTVAKELSSRGVTCNAIAPGFIETEMTASLPDSIKENALKAIPLKRMGKAEEVANLTLFLASEMSSYITGEVIRIDGGLCM